MKEKDCKYNKKENVGKFHERKIPNLSHTFVAINGENHQHPGPFYASEQMKKMENQLKEIVTAFHSIDRNFVPSDEMQLEECADDEKKKSLQFSLHGMNYIRAQQEKLTKMHFELEPSMRNKQLESKENRQKVIKSMNEIMGTINQLNSAVRKLDRSKD
ncbi:hypothetical protein SNEBB_007183 [Seison nebaliae]|nr:hypothetical protein SNEBB_007183 [Seison nebaliae]